MIFGIINQTFFKTFLLAVDKWLKKEYNVWVKGKGVFELYALSVFASFFDNNRIAYKGNGVF